MLHGAKVNRLLHETSWLMDWLLHGANGVLLLNGRSSLHTKRLINERLLHERLLDERLLLHRASDVLWGLLLLGSGSLLVLWLLLNIRNNKVQQV